MPHNQQTPQLPYMVTLGCGDCDKDLYEFQLYYISILYKVVYIWGEHQREGDVYNSTVPEIYASKQTEYQGVD